MIDPFVGFEKIKILSVNIESKLFLPTHILLFDSINGFSLYEERLMIF